MAMKKLRDLNKEEKEFINKLADIGFIADENLICKFRYPVQKGSYSLEITDLHDFLDNKSIRSVITSALSSADWWGYRRGKARRYYVIKQLLKKILNTIFEKLQMKEIKG